MTAENTTHVKQFQWSVTFRRPLGVVDVSQNQADGESTEPKPRRRPATDNPGTPCK